MTVGEPPFTYLLPYAY